MTVADCCGAVKLVADHRFTPRLAGISERVVRCETCGSLWIEEWHVRVGYGGADDRDVFEYRRVTEAEAAEQLGRT